jgi:subtilisin-like proprotein convertase family protein
VNASTQLQVGINIATTFSGDVDAYLIGPAGCGTIELTTDNGSSGDGFNLVLYNTGAYPSVTTLPTTGTPTGNYMMEGTVLTSPATLSGTGTLNYPSVVYTPINGCPVNGTWTMFVGDDASGDVPTLNSWSLTVIQPGIGNYTDAFSGPGTFGTTTYSGANNSTGTTTVTGLTPGTYVFSVTTTDATGCTSGAATTSVTVLANTTYYADADGDTYGDAASTTTSCTGAPVGYVADNTDCNDGNASINPGATEVCNGIDDDCDGSIDEGLTFTNYYVDADGDGYGDASASPVSSCAPVAGYVANNTDCNDANNLINPAGTEICNGVDDDCDGTVDDGILYTIYYADADGDTYGDAATAVSTCDGAPVGYVTDNTDCNDANAAINPGATEICNGIDDDCDGSIDEGLTFTTYYADVDGDTYGDAFNTTTTCDGMPTGYVANNTDCDDTQNTVYPGATEICDGLDNDCDGEFDEGTVTATVTPSGTITICKGVPTPLNANTGVGYTYQWFKNGNVIIGATGATYFATKPGNYQVQVNTPEGCFALSTPTLVQVNPQPNANISAPNGTSLCVTVKLKASYDATYTWQWYKDGSPIGGATSYLYIATTPGSYECVITNAYGCTRTTAALTVTACREGETVESVAVETFELYPNPTESIFTLDMELNTTEQEASVYIVNLIGEQVYAGTVGVDHGTVNTTITLDDEIAAGMYVVKVIVAEKEYTKQLIIQK